VYITAIIQVRNKSSEKQLKRREKLKYKVRAGFRYLEGCEVKEACSEVTQDRINWRERDLSLTQKRAL
jgi:hypothetical protein